MSRRLLKLLAVALAGVLVVGVAVLVRNIFFGPRTISAVFTTARTLSSRRLISANLPEYRCRAAVVRRAAPHCPAAGRR